MYKHKGAWLAVVVPTGAAMASTHKKVIVRKLDRDAVNGYVSASSFITDGRLELLNTAGNVVQMDLREVKGVYFVREFTDNEALTRKTFATRPRVEGLWVKLRFKDNDVIEGLMANDLTQIGAEGVYINPPDARSNTQRVFVPRSALAELSVIAVIGANSRKRKPPAAERPVQPALFGEM